MTTQEKKAYQKAKFKLEEAIKSMEGHKQPDTSEELRASIETLSYEYREYADSYVDYYLVEQHDAVKSEVQEGYMFLSHKYFKLLAALQCRKETNGKSSKSQKSRRKNHLNDLASSALTPAELPNERQQNKNVTGNKEIQTKREDHYANVRATDDKKAQLMWDTLEEATMELDAFCPMVYDRVHKKWKEWIEEEQEVKQDLGKSLSAPPQLSKKYPAGLFKQDSIAFHPSNSKKITQPKNAKATSSNKTGKMNKDLESPKEEKTQPRIEQGDKTLAKTGAVRLKRVQNEPTGASANGASDGQKYAGNESKYVVPKTKIVNKCHPNELKGEMAKISPNKYTTMVKAPDDDSQRPWKSFKLPALEETRKSQRGKQQNSSKEGVGANAG